VSEGFLVDECCRGDFLLARGFLEGGGVTSYLVGQGEVILADIG
jgi:hypothetical protein